MLYEVITDNSEKLNYRFTTSRLDYQGTQEGSEQQKNTFGLTSSLKMSDKLSFDVFANYINTITNNRPYQLGQVLGSFSGFFSRTEDIVITSYSIHYTKLYEDECWC